MTKKEARKKMAYAIKKRDIKRFIWINYKSLKQLGDNATKAILERLMAYPEDNGLGKNDHEFLLIIVGTLSQ